MRFFYMLAILVVLFFGGLGASIAYATESVEQLRAKAEQGNAEVQTLFGLMYDQGIGVPQDSSQAAFWTRKAAEQGNPFAQALLGDMYYSGNGVPQDTVQAISWVRKSAEQGYADAQLTLGLAYTNGTAISQDFIQAYMWFNLAANKGVSRAIEARGLLLKVLTPSQIEEGQRLTREWLAAHPQAQTAQ